MSDQTKPQGVGAFEWINSFRATDKDITDDNGKRLLTASVVAVALVLMSYATYATGTDARPSGTSLATGAGVNRSTVTYALAALVGLGWIEITASPVGKPKVYRLTLPQVPVSHLPATDVGGCVSDVGGCVSDVGGLRLSPQDMLMTSVLTSSTSYTPTAIEIRASSKPVDPWNDPHAGPSHRKPTTASGSRRTRDGY